MFDIGEYRYGGLDEAARERHLINQAAQRLKALGARDFNLLEDEDECLCLEKNGGLWVIFYSERGSKTFVAAFSSLSNALDHMAVELLGRFPLGLDWSGLYAEPL
ncbi:MAG: hypothetical protein HGA75_15025 [Thiobacillus sp.]|nr:hypothetical protein [Thiobacillus sp.]